MRKMFCPAVALIGFFFFLPSLFAQFTLATNGNAITIVAFTGVSAIVPAVTNGLPVTSIGDHAFSNGFVNDATIPDSVTNLGVGAFQNCRSLRSITIGQGITTIGSNAFQGCVELTNFIFPVNLSNIGDNTFNGCTILNYLLIPDGVTNIGVNAFLGCAGLTNLVIGKGVTNINNGAFANCHNLASIDFAGNAPGVTTPFSFDYLTIYYLPGSSGWSSQLGGQNTALFPFGFGNRIGKIKRGGVTFLRHTVVQSGKILQAQCRRPIGCRSFR